MQLSSVNRTHLIVILLAWLAVHTILLIYPGIRLELFDSKVYIQAADYFMQHGQLQETYQIFYATLILLIGMFDFFSNGLTCFIIFQSLVSLMAVFALYRASSILFNDLRAGLLTALMFLFWWDTVQWNTALLTESLFCSLICFYIAHLVRFNDSKSHFLLILIFLWLCILTRPTGVIFIIAAIIFLFKRYEKFMREDLTVSITLIVLVLSIAVLGAIAMFSIWDFTDQYIRGNIVTYIDTFNGDDFGLRLDTKDVVRPDPQMPPAMKIVTFVFQNPVHFLHAAALKIFYLLSGMRPYYSMPHNVFSVLWNLVIYSLFTVGYRHCTNKPVRTAVLTIIVINCMLIGISTVDWDNRFYVPMVPGLVLFSAGGALHLLKKFSAARVGQ